MQQYAVYFILLQDHSTCFRYPQHSSGVHTRITVTTASGTGRNIGAVPPSNVWLRYCATNQQVASSIPHGVIGIFH
jgi:hypothetical protein